jgi:hypothetical protein
MLLRRRKNSSVVRVGPCLQNRGKSIILTILSLILKESIGTTHRACLAMDWTGSIQNPPKKKKKISKSTLTFLLFISHQSLLIIIQIKKITTKQKISFFFIQTFLFFSHINQICYSTSPLL